MSWPVAIGVIAGFVAGANLGVLLMVALRAGRPHDDAYDTAALIARIRELERALAQQPLSSPGAVRAAERPGPTSVSVGRANEPGVHRSRPA